ncbi:MAG: winged helix-turn-helix domain-containing protein [Acidobacteriota bacterium]
MSQRVRRLYEFGDFRLDLAERALLRQGEAVALTPKVFDLLTLLVENRGRLMEKDELLKTLWPNSFIEEANLNVNVSALRRALGERPNAPQYIETVAKRGYRFVATVKEVVATEQPVEISSTSVIEKFPPAAIVENPETLQPPVIDRPLEVGVRASKKTFPLHPQSWLLIGVATLIMGSAIYLIWRTTSGDEASEVARIRTIAVLPFKSSNASDSDNALGLGMADALINRLSNIQQLSVRPTSTIQKYVDLNFDSLTAGREIGVDGLLEGLIQREDNRIRITVKLMRVQDGKVLWWDKYDDYFTNLFALQDSISEKMAERLSLKLTGEEQKLLTKRHTENTQAYELYVQGQFYATKLTEDGAHKAVQYFKEAIAKDPAYVLPHAGLAGVYLTLASFNSSAEWRKKAEEEAKHTVSMDDQVADAYGALGLVSMHANWDWEDAEKSFRRAIEINPNHAMTRLYHSTLLTALGRHEEAIKEMEIARQLDPVSIVINRDLAWTYYCARRYDLSIEQCRKVIEMEPRDVFSHRQLGKTYMMQAKYDDAIRELKRSIELYYGRDGVSAELCQVYALAGNREQAEKMVAELTNSTTAAPLSSYRKALLYISLGDLNVAFDWFEKAIADKEPAMVYFKAEPQLDALHSDHRYLALLRRLKFS